jgi:hypothetical protein
MCQFLQAHLPRDPIADGAQLERREVGHQRSGIVEPWSGITTHKRAMDCLD